MSVGEESRLGEWKVDFPPLEIGRLEVVKYGSILSRCFLH